MSIKMNKSIKRKIIKYINVFFCKLITRIKQQITIVHDSDDGLVIAYCPRVSVLINPSIEIIQTVGLKENYRYRNDDLRKTCEANEDLVFPKHNVYWTGDNKSIPKYLSEFLNKHRI